MRTIKMTNGTQVTLDGDLLSVLEALYIEVTAKRELERTFEDMVREIQHLIEQMTDDERRQYLSESLFLNTVSYENERLGAYMKKLTRKVTPRVPELPRHPVHVQLAVEHDGHALRRPDGVRLRRSLRQARARRYAQRDRVRRSGPASAPPALRRDLNAGGSKFCGDCPLKLPLKKDELPPSARPERRAAAVAAVHRVHGGLQHLVRAGLLRPGDRHHPHAPGRHARLRAVPPRRSTRRARRSAASTSSTTAKRSSTSARSRCASTSRRAFPHIYLYTSTNGLAFTEEQARRLVRSGIDEVTFSIDGATRGELRASTGSAATSTRRFAT